MLEQVNEHRGARSDVATVQSRPELIWSPPDAYRAVSWLEPVLVDDGASVTRRRVQLERVASTVNADERGCGDAGRNDVSATA